MLLCFVALYIPSFLFPDTRLLEEAAGDLLFFTQQHWIDTPHNRLSIVQNKILPWLLQLVGAPFNYVAYAYLVNDLLFYLIFFFILVVSRNYLAAAFLLLIQLLLWKLNFFVLTSEVSLTFPWVFVWGLMMEKGQSKAWQLLVVSTAVLWSHPFCIVLFILFNFVFGYYKQVPLGVAAYLLFTVVIRGLLIVFDAYDSERVLNAFEPKVVPSFNLVEYLTGYLVTHAVFVLGYFLWFRKANISSVARWIFAAVWLALLVLCILNQRGALHLHFAKWLLPVHFIIIYALYLRLKTHHHSAWWLTAVATLIVIGLAVEALILSFGYINHKKLADNVHCLVNSAIENNYSKAYINLDKLQGAITYNEFQQESIVLSQFPEPKVPVQVLMITGDRIDYIKQLPENEVYVMDDFIELLPFRKPFDIKPSIYKELTAEDCDCLQYF